MYIYACSYKHPDGTMSYYVGKRKQTYEQSRWYLGSGVFCKNFKKKYGKEYTKNNVVKKILMHSLPDHKTLCKWERIFISHYRLIYGSLCKNQAEGGEGGGGPGKKNQNYDHKIYSLRNVQTGETFFGTRYDFTQKYNLYRTGVDALVRGEKNHYRYWVLNSSKIKSVDDIKRMRSKRQKGSNGPRYNINSKMQIHQRAYASGDIGVLYEAFIVALNNPKHPKHDEYTKLYNKHLIKEG